MFFYVEHWSAYRYVNVLTGSWVVNALVSVITRESPASEEAKLRAVPPGPHVGRRPARIAAWRRAWDRSARLRPEPATWPHRRPSTELGITGELARCLGTTNVIESPNLVVRRVSGRGRTTRCTDGLALDSSGLFRGREIIQEAAWVCADEDTAQRSSVQCPTTQEVSIIAMITDSNLQLRSGHRLKIGDQRQPQ